MIEKAPVLYTEFKIKVPNRVKPKKRQKILLSELPKNLFTWRTSISWAPPTPGNQTARLLKLECDVPSFETP